MIPFYILGLLQRFGPMHGYQIKKTISEQLADFTQIKLPTIYYHLEKMESNDLLSSSSEKSGERPQKTVYNITDSGVNAFKELLGKLLEFDYQPTFSSDGLFYFSEYMDIKLIVQNLQDYVVKLENIIKGIKAHREETMRFIPAEAKAMVSIVFNHHIKHYQAELDWARESLETLS